MVKTPIEESVSFKAISDWHNKNFSYALVPDNEVDNIIDDENIDYEAAYHKCLIDNIADAIQTRTHNDSDFLEGYINHLDDNEPNKAKLQACWDNCDCTEAIVELYQEALPQAVFENDFFNDMVSYEGTGSDFIIKINNQPITKSEDVDNIIFAKLQTLNLTDALLDTFKNDEYSNFPEILEEFEQQAKQTHTYMGPR